MRCSRREADMLGVRQTWLNSTYSHVAIEVYDLDERYRSTDICGSVALYMHDSALCCRRQYLEKEQLENVWQEIKCPAQMLSCWEQYTNHRTTPTPATGVT